LVCETIVRLVRPASDIFPADPDVDPILGIRLLPFQSGQDGQGFRNTTAAGYFPIVCFYRYLKSQNVSLPPQYECAVHYEREITRWLHNLITANGFRFIDVFPRMEQAANQGGLLYHASSDAHPNIAGNQLIAQILAEALKKKSFLISSIGVILSSDSGRIGFLWPLAPKSSGVVCEWQER
jgi:hypothetical protein